MARKRKRAKRAKRAKKSTRRTGFSGFGAALGKALGRVSSNFHGYIVCERVGHGKGRAPRCIVSSKKPSGTKKSHIRVVMEPWRSRVAAGKKTVGKTAAATVMRAASRTCKGKKDRTACMRREMKKEWAKKKK